MSRDEKIEQRAMPRVLKVLEKYRKKCSKDMRIRLLSSLRSDNGDPQEPLTYKGRKYPNLPILIQSGNLKDSIKVSASENLVKGSFFVASGSDLAQQHNDGYTYTMRNGKQNTVPARPCLDIPEQYKVDGTQLNLMLDDMIDIFDEEIDREYGKEFGR
tara:strand:+ start:3075 stop:3548 length:474 start_codon:yes stop_codon:yes gene_type:complete